MGAVKGSFCGMLVLCCSLSAHAAGIFRADAASTAATPDGQTWATAYASLQAATDAAAAAGGGEVWAKAGTYTATTNPVLSTKPDVALYGGFAGTETSREERDWTANATTIDGQDARRGVKGADRATLDGFTITRGNAYEGGGMYVGAASVTVANCIFTRNTATGDAGAMLVGGKGTTITNCIFTCNTSKDDGGAVDLWTSSSAKITNCTFAHNTAASYGGAVYNYSTSTVMTNCILWDNFAPNYPEACLDFDATGSSITWSCIQGGFAGTGNISANPLFVSVPDDLRLRLDSPCVDTGTADGAPHADILGLARPQGAKMDMGAHEGAVKTDLAAPVVAGSALHTGNTQPTWTWSTGGGGGTGYYRCGFTEGVWDGINDAAETSFTPATPLADGLHVLYVQERRDDGQWSPSGSCGIYVDLTPPTGTVTVNGGAAAALGASVTLTLTADDGAGSGVTDMQFSNDGVVWSGWVPFATQYAWLIGASYGINTVHARYRDAVGNTSTVAISDNIDYWPFHADAASTAAKPDGKTWATAYRTIQAATDAAAAAGGGDVWVKAGTYTPKTGSVLVYMKANVALYGGFAGTETSREERDWTANATTIDGKDYVQGLLGGTRTTLDGFTITRCKSSQGGGVFITSGPITVANCIFTGNTATDSGGAICVHDSDITISNCTFSNNTSGDYGGGLFVDRASNVRVTNCTFAHNTAASYGGAICNSSVASVIANCILWDNFAPNCPEACLDSGATGSSITWSCIQGGFAGTGNISANPLFVSVPDDLRLRLGSPCVDAGTADGAPPADIRGVARPQGAGMDMGAHEGAVKAELAAPLVTGSVSPTGNALPTWTWSTGGGGGTGYYRCGFTEGVWDGINDAAETSFTPATPLADGLHVLYVQERGDDGQWSTSGTCGIYVDLTPPTGTVTVNGGAAAALGASVMLTLTADDGAGSGVTHMRFSDDGVVWSEWVPFATQYAWVIGASYGIKTVHAQYRDALGNASTVAISDDIDYRPVHADAASTAATPDGQSWATAYPTLQAATDAAAAAGGGDVWVKAGTYTASTGAVLCMKANVALYGGFAGTETDRDQRDWTVNLTSTGRVIGQRDCTFDGFIISARGRGISVDVDIIDGHSMAVANCTFSSNTTAIYCKNNASIVLSNCTFTGNSESAIFVPGSGTWTVKDCTFTGNSAEFGGAIFMGRGGAGGQFYNCTFSGNSASTGGVIYVNGGGAEFHNCTFTDNHVSDLGGVFRFTSYTYYYTEWSDFFNMYVDYHVGVTGSSIVCDGCLFSGNSAANGGVLSAYVESNNRGSEGHRAWATYDITLKNCAFVNNTAHETGGVMRYSARANAGSGTDTPAYAELEPHFVNCTAAGNSAPSGSVIYREYANAGTSLTPHIANSIVWGNSGNPLSSGADVTWSCVQGGHPGLGNIDADPRFVNVPDNLQLRPDSPCVDACDSGPATDLLDVARPQGRRYDMGAYEFTGLLRPRVSSDSAFTASTQPTWTWATDSGAGTGHFRCGFTDGVWDLVNDQAVTSYTPSLPLAEGPHTLYVQERDVQGNWSDSASCTVTVDLTGPTGSIVVNSGEASAQNPAVTLSLTADDGMGAGVTDMQFSNDGEAWSWWKPFKKRVAWTLSEGYGVKTVFVRYRDALGNVSAAPISDTIVFEPDTIPPTGTIQINGGAASTVLAVVTLALGADDGGGLGVTGMQFSNDGTDWTDWEPYGVGRSWTLYGGYGLKTVFVRYRDAAGNVSTSPISATITREGPTGSIAINDGAAGTYVRQVTLALNASDGDGPGVTDMQFSNDGEAWTEWEPFGTPVDWTLPEGYGLKTVFVRYRDVVGNVSAPPISDTIAFEPDTTPPTGNILINNDTDIAYETPVTLTLSAGDGDGLGVTDMQFSNDGAGWSDWEPYQTSKSWTLSEGDGLKTVSARYRDAAGNVSVDQISDSITLSLDIAPPTGTILINGGAPSAAIAAVTLSLSANDGDGSGVTHMQFSNDGAGWSDWEPYQTTKSWTLSDGDGSKTVSVRYRDAVSLVSTGTISASILLDSTRPIVRHVNAASSAVAPDGFSWATAFRDINSAINSAYSVGGGEVWVAGGTYAGTSSPVVTMKAGVSMYAGFTGVETAREQRNWQVNVTVIKLTSYGTCVYGATNTVFDGFTLTPGDSPVSSISGMYNYGCTSTVQNCVFSGFSGNGMHNRLSPVTVIDCTFSGNKSTYDGGTMYNYDCSPAVMNCVFSNNTTTKDGGGMQNFRASPTVMNCVFSNNTTTGYGGGMYNYSGSPNVLNCMFSGNKSTEDGGGMYNYGHTPNVMDCVFQGNTAGRDGGGMYNYACSSTVMNCVFSNNTSTEDGGGMYNNGYRPNMMNCVFRGNAAERDGGGIYNSSSSPNITNCTFTANSAAAGGCMSNDEYAHPALKNCILWGDSASSGPEIRSTSTLTVTWSCIQGGWTGTGNIDADPQFVNAPDDLRLKTGSPCIDSGTGSGGPPTDILGVLRPQGPEVDMGAYEHGLLHAPAVSVAAPLTNNPTPTWTWTSGGGSGTGHYRCGFADGVWDQANDIASTSYTPSAPLPDGTYTLYVQERDEEGLWGPTGSCALHVDATPPVIVLAPPSATVVSGGPLSFTVFYTEDGGTGMAEITLCPDDIRLNTTGTATGTVSVSGDGQTPPTVTVSDITGDGTISVSIAAGTGRDQAGNPAPAAGPSATVTVDTTPPTGGILLDYGALATASLQVWMLLNWEDAGGTGVTRMRFSDDGAHWSLWEPVTGLQTHMVPAGDGYKTVRVQFRDRAGNVSAPINDYIKLDSTPPTGTLTINGGAVYTNTAKVTLGTTASDGAGSGVTEMRFIAGATTTPWEPFRPAKSLVLPGTDGVKNVYAQYKDAVGIVSRNTISARITLDATPPTVRLNINGGAASTNDPHVTLGISADDAKGSGIDRMRLSETGKDWSAWQPFSTAAAFALTGHDGAKTVYAQAIDRAGNLSAPGMAVIQLDRGAPVATITPVTSSPTSADALVFRVDFNEPLAAPLAASAITVTGTLPGTAAVAGADPQYTVTVTPADPDADGTVGIALAAGAVADALGRGCAAAESALCTVHNWPGPINPIPAELLLYAGDSYTLDGQVDEGGVPTTYQWHRDDGRKAVTDGPAAPQWPLPNLGPEHNGTYWCEVTFDGVPHPSDPVTLQVQPHVAITVPPVGGDAEAGGRFTFSVTAEGGYGTLEYQWKKDGDGIGGANDTTYTLTGITTADAGQYTVEISDANSDTVASDPVTLAVSTKLSAAGPAALVLLAAAVSVLAARRKQVKSV